MNKRLYVLTSLALAAAVLLTACASPTEKAAKACAEPGAVTYTTDGRTYDCASVRGDPQVPAPAAEAAPPYVAAPSDDPQVPVPGTCTKDALTASHDDNLESGRYEMSYFGGTSEACFMFGEFNFGVADQTWLVIVPPGYTLNLGGFIGETMWYRESEGAVAWSIDDSTANLTRPDGRDENDPIVVWVNNPDDLQLLPSVAEFEVIPPAK